MDKYSGLPNWVQKSKKSLKQTQEWQTYMMKLYDLVHHQMHEMGVSSFNDLAPPERNLLLQRAFQALKKGEAYFQLLQAASESLDENISQEANKLSTTKQQNKTKMEILQDECHKAVTSLLQKWPDSRTSLRQCLNANIPLELRYVMWKNFLKSPEAREEYSKLVARDPKKLVSKQDFEISEKCQMLLESDPTLKQIPNRKAACSVMRHLLSYHHTKLKSRGGLIETDYLLAVPFVVCTLSARQSPGATQQLTTESFATLIEEFDAFMNKRPDYMMTTQGRSLDDLSTKTGSLIRKHDTNLARTIEKYKIGQKEVTNAKIEAVLSLLLHSIVRSLFVGYFPLETVMHTWDLVILGFDYDAYDPAPFICASVFLLLRKELSKCQSEKEAMTIIMQGCRNIQKDRLILALKEFGFEKQLKQNLNIAEEDHFPVFHPALKSNLPPWKHWYSSKLVSHIQDERNETAVRRAMTVQDPSHSPRSDHLENGGAMQDWQLEQMKLELEDDAERLRQERNMLAADVERERRLRIEMQQQADEEIERLRRQLNAAQRSNGRRQDTQTPDEEPRVPPPSVISSKERVVSRPPSQPKVATPPPVVPVKTPTPEPETPPKAPTPKPKTPTPEVEKSQEKVKAKKTTDDFLFKMMEGVNFVVHGDKKERRDLDKMTQKDIQKLTVAFKKAQISVYGKAMTDADIAQLPDDEREQKGLKAQEETLRLLFKQK
ncbi:uncharacterized protein LOC120327175 [Styela clava]